MYEPLVTHVTQKICNGLQYRIGWFCKQKINSTYRKKIRKCNTKISSKRGHGLGRGAADRGCKRACCIHFYIEPTNLHGVCTFIVNKVAFKSGNFCLYRWVSTGFFLRIANFFWTYLIIFKSFPAALVDFNWKNSQISTKKWRNMPCLTCFPSPHLPISLKPITKVLVYLPSRYLGSKICRFWNLFFFTMFLTALYCLTSSWIYQK